MGDLTKTIKKVQLEIKDMQDKYMEEHNLASEYREQFSVAERRGNALHGELEESRTLLEQSDRGRRQAEADLADTNEQYQDLMNQHNALSIAKRKLESEYQTMSADLSDMVNDAKASEDKAKKAMVDAARLADELEGQFDDQTHKHSDAQKNLRKHERKIKELSFQMEENKKSHGRMEDLVEKLQLKVKTYKKQIDEAEEIAALNLAKYRKAQGEIPS